MAKIQQLRNKIFKRKILHLSRKELRTLYNYPEYCYNYARLLNLENIPKKVLRGISKNWIYSYYFLLGIHSKNISILNYKKFIEIVAKNDTNFSGFLFKFLNYKDIPESLIHRAENSWLKDQPKIQQCVLEHNRKKKLAKLLS